MAERDDSMAYLEEAERGIPRFPLMVIALILLAALIAGGWWVMQGRGGEQGGEGALIAAPTTPYRVKAEGASGMDIEGQGDAAFAASQGEEERGQLDLAAAPEAPMPVKRQAEPVPEAASPAATGPATTGPAAPGTVQLGSFDTQARAEAGWTGLSKRFAYLAPLDHSVATAEVGGRTVYRLRASAGTEAASVCARLRVAGENCLVVG